MSQFYNMNHYKLFSIIIAKRVTMRVTGQVDLTQTAEASTKPHLCPNAQAYHLHNRSCGRERCNDLQQ